MLREEETFSTHIEKSGREGESKRVGRRGGSRGTVPGNDDWALWRRGGRVGEERAARFLAGYGRDRYGLFPARSSQTERKKEKTA